MRFQNLAIALVLAVLPCIAGAQGTAGPARRTLAEAMRLAESASRDVRLREAQLVAAEGLQRQASTLLANNPELNVEGSRTRTQQPPQPNQSSGWAVGIAQPFEIGGQQARRRVAAAAALQALRAEIDEARRQARADAATRFQAVLAAQHRIQIEQRSVDLFESTAQAVAKRRAAGEDTRLDANVALVEVERARNALAVAREQWLDARSDLATVLQLPPFAPPEVVGELATSPGDALSYNLDQLLASAQALPRVRALAAREDSARARLGVERASRYPDLTLGLNVGREGPGDARDSVTTLSLSVPLPLFKRNDAGIGQALTDVTQAEIERGSALRDQTAQVRRLWTRLASQRQRVQRLQREIVPASADNQQLAAKSRQAGQIGLLEQLLVNRQALDAERDLNDALAEFHATRIELEHAAGWPHGGASQ